MSDTAILSIDEFWEMVEERTEDQRARSNGALRGHSTVDKWRKARLATQLGHLLLSHATTHQLGFVMVNGPAFTLTAADDVAQPAVAFVSHQRLPYFAPVSAVFPPDLAIEIILPTDVPADIGAHTALYLRSGVRMVWNVFLVAEVVEIWTMGHTNNTFIMSRRETGRAVDGGEVLPGFSVPVHELFDGN